MSEGCGLVDQWYLMGLSMYRKKSYEGKLSNALINHYHNDILLTYASR